jgi:hypothetical protein
MGMKKVSYAVLSAVISLTALSTPAHADTKSLVIIDSYFDVSKFGANISQVCVATDKCVNKAKPSTTLSDPANHGTVMVDIALKQDPSIKVIVIRASDVSSTGAVYGVTGNTFLSALQWVETNKSIVGAVSFSYSLSGNMTKIGDCKLSSFGLTNISVVDPKIRASIANLKISNVPVFAATGNSGPTKPVSYPACITDTNAIGAGVGGAYIPSSSRDANTDGMGSLPANVFSYKSNIFGLISQSTSAATVAVAAKYISTLVDKGTVFVVS